MSSFFRRRISSASSCAMWLAVVGVSPLWMERAQAATVYWDTDGVSGGATGGTGNWNTTATLWDNAGTMQAWNNATPDSATFGGAAGTVTLTTGITADSLTFSTAGYVVTGNVLTLAGSATITANADATIHSGLAGAAGLTKTGTGTLTLGGGAANPFTGGVNVNEGTLALDYANVGSDLIGGGNALTLGGGTLSVNGNSAGTSQTFASTTLNGGANTIRVTSNGAATDLVLGEIFRTAGSTVNFMRPAAGSISTGTGTANMILGGYATVSGTDWAAKDAANTGIVAYTGYTAMVAAATSDTANARVTGGLLNLSGSHTHNTLKIENPSALASLGLGANLLTLTGGGLLVTGGNSTAINGTAGGTRLTAGNGSGAYDLVVQQYNTGGLTINAVIGDNGANAVSLTKAGTGTLTLSGINTYKGGTTVQQGTLVLSSKFTHINNILSGTGTLTLSGGTLGLSATANSAAIAIPTISVTAGTLNTISPMGANALNYGLTANIIGSGTLAVTGLGSGANTHFLSLSGDISGFGGVFTYDGSGGGTVTKGFQFNNATSNYTYDGSNAKFFLNATGGTGGFLGVGGNAAAANTDTFKMGELSGTANTTIKTIGSNTNAVNLMVGYLNTDSTFAGVLTNGGTTGASLAFAKLGTGSLTLSGANTYTGTTTVAAGTLQFAKAVSFYNSTEGSVGAADAAKLTVNPGATAAFNVGGSGEFTAADIDTLRTGNGTVGFLAGSTLGLDTTGGSFVYGAHIGNPNGGANALGLTKLGANALTLAGANTYTGVTTVNAGVLAAGSTTAFGAATTASLAFGAGSTGTVRLNGNTMTIIGLNTDAAAPGTPIVENGALGIRTLTVDNSVDNTYAGVLQNGAVGTLALTKTGAGTLTLTGLNTFTGNAVVNGGVLRLANGGKITSTSSVITALGGAPGVTGTATISGAGSQWSVAGGIFHVGYNATGTGILNVANGGGAKVNGGAGTVTLGRLSTSAGTLNIGWDGASAGTAGIIHAATVSGVGTAVVNFHQTDAGVFSSRFTGSLSVNQLGAGTTILSGDNSYGGATTVGAGTLQIGNGGAAGTLGTGDVALDAVGATLAFNRSTAYTVSNLIGGTGMVTQNGTGTTTLTRTHTHTGGTHVNRGTLLLSGANDMPAAGILQVNAGGNFSLADGIARSTSAAQLGLANRANLTFDWNAGAVDTLTSTAAATTAGNVGIIINPANAPTGSGLTLIASLSGGLTAGGTQYYLANNTHFTATLTQSDTAVTMGGYSAVSAPTTFYWQGNKVTGLNIDGVDNAWALSAGENSNWSSTLGSYTATTVVPGSASHVVFSGGASPASQAPVLGADMAINSVTLDDGMVAAIGGDHCLTLMGTASAAGSSAITVGSAAADVTISANIRLGANQTWNIADGKTLTVSGSVVGVSGLTKADSGTLVLSGTNTYTGVTTVDGGTLKLSGAAPTILTDGSTATASDIVIHGGTLEIAASEQIADAGSVHMAGGAFHFGNASGLTETVDKFTNSGGVFTTGANTLHGLGATLTWSGGISTVSDGGLVDDGHIVISGGTNTVEGGASGGVLKLNAGGLGLEMSDGGTLTLNSDNAVAGKLQLKGNVGTSGDATVTIASGLALTHKGTIDMDGGVRTFTVADGAAATDMAIGAVVANGGLTKAGSGTLALSGTNTYAGATTVHNGTLLVNGIHNAGSGTYTVSKGVNASATLGGGTSLAAPGTLHSAGQVGIASDGQIIGGDLGAIGALEITGSGGIHLEGTYLFDVDYTGAGTGDLIRITTAAQSAVVMGGVFKLNALNAAPVAGSSYAIKIFESANGVAGVGAGQSDYANTSGLAPHQSIVTWDGGRSYYLVPEPASFALLGLGGLWLLRRPTRRRGRREA